MFTDTPSNVLTSVWRMYTQQIYIDYLFWCENKVDWGRWGLMPFLLSDIGVRWRFASRLQNTTEVKKTVSDGVEFQSENTLSPPAKICWAPCISGRKGPFLVLLMRWDLGFQLIWNWITSSAYPVISQPSSCLSQYSVHMEFWMFCVGYVCFHFGFFQIYQTMRTDVNVDQLSQQFPDKPWTKRSSWRLSGETIPCYSDD